MLYVPVSLQTQMVYSLCVLAGSARLGISITHRASSNTACRVSGKGYTRVSHTVFWETGSQGRSHNQTGSSLRRHICLFLQKKKMLNIYDVCLFDGMILRSTGRALIKEQIRWREIIGDGWIYLFLCWRVWQYVASKKMLHYRILDFP